MTRFGRHLVWLICFLSLWSISLDVSAQRASSKSSEEKNELCPLCSIDKNIHEVEKVYKVPAVTLRDQDRQSVALKKMLEEHPGPVVFQFAFTSCTTLCPIMTGAFSGARRNLGEADDDVLYVTVSIDPQFDTSAKLKAYGKPLGADQSWRFLTGAVNDVVSVQKAFDAYPGNKARHEALTFMRPANCDAWQRVTGVMSAKTLEAKIRKLLTKPGIKASKELGRRIYEQGILPNGEFLTATIAGDIPFIGKNAACAKCHRHSGYGSDEPGKMVPTITGEVLFDDLVHQRSREFRALYQEPQTSDERSQVRARTTRPAYTLPSLQTALNEGTDPVGREFNSLQPRYELSEQDVAHLAAYLQTLGASSPGVDQSTIQFAVVTDDTYSAEKRAAMKATIDAFVAWKNREVARFRARPGISPLYKSEMIPSYRYWQIHYWHLTDRQSSFEDQISKRYEETPVFAFLLGGGESVFPPLVDFCNSRRIPYLFPNTSTTLPLSSGPQYTVRFANGLEPHFRGIAAYLSQRPHLENLLVLHDTPLSTRRIQEELNRQLSRNKQLDTKRVDNWNDFLNERFPKPKHDRRQPDCVILFATEFSEDTVAVLSRLSHQRLKAIAAFAVPPDNLAQIALALNHNENSLVSTIRGIHPDHSVDRFRSIKWLRTRRCYQPSHENLGLNTYFVLSLVDHSLTHMVDRHSREYLIERLEHETENMANPGVFKNLSLGPNQRNCIQQSEVIRISELSSHTH